MAYRLIKETVPSENDKAGLFLLEVRKVDHVVDPQYFKTGVSQENKDLADRANQYIDSSYEALGLDGQAIVKEQVIDWLITPNSLPKE